MRVRPPGTAMPGQRERVHHRPGPGLEMEVVEAAQHALAMRRRDRRIPGARVTACRSPRSPRRGRPPTRVPRHRRPDTANAAAPACPRPATTGRNPAPRPGSPRSQLDPDRPQEPEPAQQIHPIRPLRRRRPPARRQLGEERRHRHRPPRRRASTSRNGANRSPVASSDPRLRHHQPRQLPRRQSPSLTMSAGT